MSEFTFVKTMENKPPYISHDESGMPLLASEIGVNVALNALSNGATYQIQHGYDEKLGHWVRITNMDNLGGVSLSVSTFNHGWTCIQHYLFLNAIDAPKKTVWQVAIDGFAY